MSHVVLTLLLQNIPKRSKTINDLVELFLK